MGDLTAPKSVNQRRRELLPAQPQSLREPLLPTEGHALPWARLFAAVLRFKWVIAATVLASGVVGALFSRTLEPEYEVYATIWLSSETPQERTSGPIRPERLLNTSSWPELINSFAILDSVARKTRLYLTPQRDTPRDVFRAFDIGDAVTPGEYVLRTDKARQRFELLRGGQQLVERGILGDSVGRRIGFRWAPTRDILGNREKLLFAVTTPREASVRLRKNLNTILPRESSLLRLILTGSDARLTTETMSALVSEFVATASRLKTRNLVEFANTLGQQMSYAAQELNNAEVALEAFRVQTITLPSEAGTTIAAGIEMTRDPVLRHYFDQKLQLDSLRTDREAMERVLAGIRSRTLGAFTLWSVPAVQGAQELNSALVELAGQQAALRAAQQTYTDEYRGVVGLQHRIAALEDSVIPKLARGLLDRLQRREQDLAGRVDGSSRELRRIPARTIEETRLRRNVEVRLQLYMMLKSRYEEARLAEASAQPDLSVLDYPVLPHVPSRDPGSRVLLIAIFGGLGLGIALALLIDALDPRFRYPDQATNGMGLEIVGVVPDAKRVGSRQALTEKAWHITEAFRTIRVGVMHAHDSFPVMLTITSPGSGDGKSLVASNLALSLASAGLRTLLVDADVRRGVLHASFGLPGRPGLTEFLTGQTTLEGAIFSVSGGLNILPAGTRSRKAAELLTSKAMVELINRLRNDYDAVVVDSAPLAAGVDACVLGTLTVNMLLVLRAGVTDRKLADAKLRILDRLPVRVLGAVLNGVKLDGAYRYYSYYDAGARGSESIPAIIAAN